MDCKHFDSMLEDLERDTSLPAGTRDQALQHAEDCAYCRARLAAARLLSLELSALAKSDERLQAPAPVEAGLLRAFRERTRRRSRVWWSVRWASAAAAVAIAAWLLAEHPWRGRSPARPNVEAVVPAVTRHSTPPAGIVKRQNETTEVRARGERPRPVRHRARAADAAGEYIALSSTSYPVGDGMVVRVELPRSAPALVGLPIPGGDVSGTVTADVVLGQDGMARAIRFVQSEEGQSANKKLGLEQNY